MATCGSEFVQPVGDGTTPVVCPGGHLGKFASCLDEALHGWSLEDSTSSTGTTEFDGHLAVVVVHVDDVWGLGQTDGPDEREVIIPAGNYLVWTANSGAVEVRQVETEQEAWAIYGRVDARYAAWEAGCNPDDLVGHEDCGDSCHNPEWVDR
jgi:hypothetical protein